MEVGHPLAGAAAEFAQIVPRRRTGNQRNINGHKAFAQSAGGGDGDVMDAGDVLKCAIGRYFQPQTHELIDKFALPETEETGVGIGGGGGGKLLLGEKVEGPERVVGKKLPLGGEEHLQHGEEEHRAGGENVRRRGLFREEEAAGIVIGIRRPTALRFPGAVGAQGFQVRAEEGKNVGAAQAGAVEKAGETLHIALRFHLLEQRKVRGGTVGKAAAQQ